MPRSKKRWGWGGCHQSITVPLCHSLLLTLFTCSSVGASHDLQLQLGLSTGCSFLQEICCCSGVGSSALQRWPCSPPAAACHLNHIQVEIKKLGIFFVTETHRLKGSNHIIFSAVSSSIYLEARYVLDPASAIEVLQVHGSWKSYIGFQLNSICSHFIPICANIILWIK